MVDLDDRFHSDQRFSTNEVGALVRDLKFEFTERDLRLKLRNELIYRRPGNDAEMGNFLPDPFHKSQLILKFRTTEVSDATARIVADVTSSKPSYVVSRILTSDARISQKANANAANLELGLNAIFEENDRRDHIREKVTWSQVAEETGWYLVYPHETGFGLPDRMYYEDLLDDQIETLQVEGKITPTMINDPTDNQPKFAESADVWRERRQEAMKLKAVNGQSLFIYEPLQASKVYVRRDKGPGGVKMGAVMEMIPAQDFMAGTELARELAVANGVRPEDVDRFGLYTDKDGVIHGGVSSGNDTNDTQHPDHRTRWLLARIWTRDEMYVYVAGNAHATGGKVVMWRKHGFRRVPLFEVPGVITASDLPGEDRLPLLDGMIALSPVINQVTTMMSSVATWNAIPRFVVQMPNGELVADPDTGKPLVIDNEDGIGLDPKLTQLIRGGTVQQLTIDDKGMLLKLLDFFYARLTLSAPSTAETGTAGGSGAAWTLRQLQQASAARNNKLVEYHAEALAEIGRFEVDMLRQLDVPVYFLAAPGERQNAERVRGLIEFNPDDAPLDITVSQSANTPEQVTVATQVAVDLWEKNVITKRDLYERMEFPDPDAKVFESDVDAVVNMIMFGSAEGIDPASVVAQTVHLVRGELTEELLAQSPRLQMALAGARAEEQAMQQQQAAQTPGVPQGGTLGGAISDASGVRQPGLGMDPTLEGLGQPPGPGPAQPPIVG
jgi:hypothetical protein